MTGATSPMLPTTGSTITPATCAPWVSMTRAKASTSLKGSDRVAAAVASGTPGLPGMPSVATPEPAATSSVSACPW